MCRSRHHTIAWGGFIRRPQGFEAERHTHSYTQLLESSSPYLVPLPLAQDVTFSYGSLQKIISSFHLSEGTKKAGGEAKCCTQLFGEAVFSADDDDSHAQVSRRLELGMRLGSLGRAKGKPQLPSMLGPAERRTDRSQVKSQHCFGLQEHSSPCRPHRNPQGQDRRQTSMNTGASE